MKTLLKIVGGLIAFMALSLAVLLVFFPTPQVPESELVAKYGQSPSQMLKLPGGTVAHYRDYAPAIGNAGPVLVLLHGSNSSLHTWEPWAQRLRTTMRVVTVDLPGHGLTGATVENDYSQAGMVAFVENFTRALGLDYPFVLAGNSMGGQVAWRYTIEHPDRVSKLVLVDAAGVPLAGPEPPPPLAFRLARNPITAPMIRRLAPRSLFASAILKSFYNKSLVTDQMIDRYWELNRRKGTADATLARFRLSRFDPAMAARLHEIAAPTLILWGREDELIPVATADVLTKTIPDSRVIVYDHCGHLPMEEVAERSAVDVRVFVERRSVIARIWQNSSMSPAHPTFLYGTAWKEDRTPALTELALRAGFRGIDTANQRRHYFEAGVGQGLAAVYRAGLVTRSDLFLQTKFTYQAGQDHRLPYDPSAPLTQQVAQSIASSLEHLGTDYVDSYVLHGPSSGYGWTEDDTEVWEAMRKERDAGRARVLGVSNVALRHLEQMAAADAEMPAFVQNRCYARLGWDRDIRAFCRERKIVYQGFSLLTANVEVLRNPAIADLAAHSNSTPAQIVFAFARAVGMLPLTGTSNAEHMKQDLESVNIVLPPEVVRGIEALAG